MKSEINSLAQEVVFWLVTLSNKKTHLGIKFESELKFVACCSSILSLYKIIFVTIKSRKLNRAEFRTFSLDFQNYLGIRSLQQEL